MTIGKGVSLGEQKEGSIQAAVQSQSVSRAHSGCRNDSLLQSALCQLSQISGGFNVRVMGTSTVQCCGV